MPAAGPAAVGLSGMMASAWRRPAHADAPAHVAGSRASAASRGGHRRRARRRDGCDADGARGAPPPTVRAYRVGAVEI
eukprot:3379322-Prymnesium_polylepis.1